jgi:HNH endonuclease
MPKLDQTIGSIKTKAPRGGARGLLRAHFLANIGRVMNSEELRQVAGNQSEWARRVRELRTEEGYQILTHNDRSHLKPGDYLLESAKPQPAFERAISKETRAFVLDRNGFTCQMCGAVAGEPHPYDPSRATRLHLGHVIDKSVGGTDDPSNLRALCSVCNEGASNATLMRPDLQKLLIQIRRATAQDQLQVMQWLIKKFPKQAL